MDKVLVVVGPTGVGKTNLGVLLAKRYNGEVISGDSMQIYRQMDIGTAKVTKEETQGIVHHLIDIKDPQDTYSVKDFQDTVRLSIQDIVSRGKTPILVGGTGLYIKAALYDYSFNESTSNHQLYKEKYAHLTNQELYQYLLEIDAKSATELHYNNRQRVLRAIEIYESTGIRKSETIGQQEHICLYNAFFIGLTLPREVLYQRIDQRVDVMISKGLPQEVESLMQQGYTSELQSMKAIGYKEWFAYYQKEQTIEQTIALIKKNSRNYAKRQYTWFKNQLPIHWFEVNLTDFNQTVEAVIQQIEG